MQRFKIYQVPHKGFRSAIAQLVIQAGSADYNDDHDLSTLRIATESVFSSLDHHAQVEEQFILSELARVDAQAAKADVEVHRQLEDVQSRALALLDRIARENKARQAAGLPACSASDETASQFYLTLTEYQAMQLRHMYQEETVTQTRLMALFGDEAIRAIDERIIGHLNATIPPEQMMVILGGLIAHSTPNERVQMLNRIRAGMPAEAFSQIWEPVTASLSARDKTKLALALA